MKYPLKKTDYFSGGGGLSSTIYDYAILLQMLLNGGEYNGVRLLARNTVRMMTMNQIGDLSVNIGNSKDNKFGFGFSIISESGSKVYSKPGRYLRMGWRFLNYLLGGSKGKFDRIVIRANVGTAYC